MTASSDGELLANQTAPSNDPNQRVSETEQVLQEILFSYRNALIEAIRAGDQQTMNHYVALIAHLTGRADTSTEIPDLPAEVHVTTRSELKGV